MSEVNVLGERHGAAWALYNADCVDFARQMPANSVDISVYSPPFSNLYTYSDSERDHGNAENDEEFYELYRHLVAELYRVLRPGRQVWVHCKDLVNYANRDGMAGLRDFPGELVRIHRAAGFAWHSRVTIWKCPVTEMQRTKAHGLLYKTLRADSTFSRQGMPEYFLVFRKWAKDEELMRPVQHTKESFPLDQWQEWASPVWMHVDHMDVLNVHAAREDKDEKHLCPLALPLSERAIVMGSNPGEVVFSPYAGIGSEGYVALRHGRRFIGTELKGAYFEHAARNLEAAEKNEQLTLFGAA